MKPRTKRAGLKSELGGTSRAASVGGFVDFKLMSLVGTNRTNRAGLAMSVVGVIRGLFNEGSTCARRALQFSSVRKGSDIDDVP
jgi:hypothetical protein